MKRFVEGEDRTQITLLPECLDDYVAKPLTSNSKADGRFGKQDFVYVPEKNEYRCPAGQSLIYRYTNLEAGLTTHAYWTSNCQQCAIKAQCTNLSYRRVRRWEHEDVSTEMSLHVLAYNLKRVMRVLGIAETMKAMQLARA